MALATVCTSGKGDRGQLCPSRPPGTALQPTGPRSAPREPRQSGPEGEPYGMFPTASSEDTAMCVELDARIKGGLLFNVT